MLALYGVWVLAIGMVTGCGSTETEINVSDYNAVVEAMKTGNADIAYYGPVSYVQAQRGLMQK